VSAPVRLAWHSAAAGGWGRSATIRPLSGAEGEGESDLADAMPFGKTHVWVSNECRFDAGRLRPLCVSDRRPAHGRERRCTGGAIRTGARVVCSRRRCSLARCGARCSGRLAQTASGSGGGFCGGKGESRAGPNEASVRRASLAEQSRSLCSSCRGCDTGGGCDAGA
jgi:hypothetical protein